LHSAIHKAIVNFLLLNHQQLGLKKMEVMLGCIAIGAFGIIVSLAESEPQSEKKRILKKRLSRGRKYI
jgi:hypothetical protein